jgi:uncharacterized protein YacL
LVFDAIVQLSQLRLQTDVLNVIKIGLFLCATYLGAIMTLRASDALYISIPFVKFSPLMKKNRDLLLDVSSLTDSRLVDLAATGLFDHQLILPSFVTKELNAQSESIDEMTRSRAKRALEVIKKLESFSNLHLRHHDIEFPELKEMMGKLLRLARLTEAAILTADTTRVQTTSADDVQFINLHLLSNALKPMMQTGENLKVKIQRYGKEARQGVAYLEDGTMVVVNGGGDFLGEEIRVRVLSVKHTASGRMIFCNTFEEDQQEVPMEQMLSRRRPAMVD